jgi:hypothetical protein
MTDNDEIDGASALAILPQSATLYIWTHPDRFSGFAERAGYTEYSRLTQEFTFVAQDQTETHDHLLGRPARR